MKFLKWFSDIAPVVMMSLTLLTAILCNFNFYSDIYTYLPDTIGYSIFTNIVFLRLYWNKRYCHPTKASIIGLMCVNVLSLLTYGTDNYEPLYDIYVGGMVIIMILIGIVRR